MAYGHRHTNQFASTQAFGLRSGFGGIAPSGGVACHTRKTPVARISPRRGRCDSRWVNQRRSQEVMSPLKRSNNIAARMGRWSASHWKIAVFGWLAFVVAAVYLGMNVGTKNLKDEDYSSGQSHRADLILKQGFPQSDPQTEFVLVQSSKLSVNAAAFRSTINDVVTAVKDNPNIKNLKNPYAAVNGDLVSDDRSTAMVTLDT